MQRRCSLGELPAAWATIISSAESRVKVKSGRHQDRASRGYAWMGGCGNQAFALTTATYVPTNSAAEVTTPVQEREKSRLIPARRDQKCKQILPPLVLPASFAGKSTSY